MITLVGLSGTGKSTAGTLLASLLGWRFVDTDSMIEADTGLPIATIFAEQGEAVFRRLESVALERALQAAPVVVATGGGILETGGNEQLLASTTVVWLTAKLDTLLARLASYRDRPLLRADPRGALQSQAARRAARFAAVADLVVATDELEPREVASEILRMVKRRGSRASAQLKVTAPGGEYDVVVEAGALRQLAARLQDLGRTGRVWIVSDDLIWSHHGPTLSATLAGAGVDVRSTTIPPGEAFKNLTVASALYDWLLQGKVERGDTLLAFGGGVVGDLAGFVASTVLRGINLVQLPTTVLAMVDSSIGGKTGVDHSAGKNLIGSFYQPSLVLADTTLLHTLPLADRRAGWAEAIKHGVIADAALFEDLASSAEALQALTEPLLSDVIRRAAAVKVGVVSGDEREQGARILLNYGHTLGHALEQWSHYTIRHGEGVAIGMTVAAAIARRLQMFVPEHEQRQRAVLRSFGLPVSIPSEADARALLSITTGDKKVRGQKMRWVLPTSIGAATVRSDVSDETVLEAIEECRSA